MPDGPVHFNLSKTAPCDKTTSIAMRKDSQSSLGNESMGSPEIIVNDERPLSRRVQLSKKVSFRDESKPTVKNNNNGSDSDSGQSVNCDDEVFEVTETKLLLKSVSNILRAHSHREVNTAANTPNEELSRRTGGHSVRCKRPKRSASFRDGLRQGESYQILMLGAVGVGKTSLVNQFQEANHCGSVVIKISNVYGDNCRRVDDAQLVIFDHPATEITAEMAMTCCDVDAYVIVYSVTDRGSFKTAQQILKTITKTSPSGDSSEQAIKKAAILVGNKVDLARRRVVSTEEGKNVAVSNGCKFIETSDWIDYNVAELFNGVLAQIRLRSEADEPAKGGARSRHGYRRSKTLGAKSWGVLKDFLNLINRKVVSCDDLQVL